jgi:TPR repeat protein
LLNNHSKKNILENKIIEVVNVLKINLIENLDDLFEITEEDLKFIVKEIALKNLLLKSIREEKIKCEENKNKNNEKKIEEKNLKDFNEEIKKNEYVRKIEEDKILAEFEEKLNFEEKKIENEIEKKKKKFEKFYEIDEKRMKEIEDNMLNEIEEEEKNLNFEIEIEKKNLNNSIETEKKNEEEKKKIEIIFEKKNNEDKIDNNLITEKLIPDEKEENKIESDKKIFLDVIFGSSYENSDYIICDVCNLSIKSSFWHCSDIQCKNKYDECENCFKKSSHLHKMVHFTNKIKITFYRKNFVCMICNKIIMDHYFSKDKNQICLNCYFKKSFIENNFRIYNNKIENENEIEMNDFMKLIKDYPQKKLNYRVEKAKEELKANILLTLFTKFEQFGILIEESQTDSNAQYLLGKYYQKGFACQTNLSFAFKYYTLSSKQNNFRGLYWLSLCYLEGIGCEKNKKKGKLILKFLSENNFNRASFYLGKLYLNKKNKNKKMFEYFSLAYIQNNKYAALEMGKCLKDGIGCEIDENKALIYFEKAINTKKTSKEGELNSLLIKSKSGDPNVFYSLGKYYYVENEKKSFEYYLIASNKGIIEAINKIGYMYEKGVGCEKDEKKAFEYFLLSSSKSDSHGLLTIGNYYEEGIGCEKNEILAFKYYNDSFNLQNDTARKNIIRCLKNGIGCTKDVKKAKELEKKCIIN